MPLLNTVASFASGVATLTEGGPFLLPVISAKPEQSMVVQGVPVGSGAVALLMNVHTVWPDVDGATRTSLLGSYAVASGLDSAKVLTGALLGPGARLSIKNAVVPSDSFSVKLRIDTY